MEIREKEITIQSKVALKGSLNLPETRREKGLAILIIQGSGKIDRNGKASEKLDLKLYRQLAEFLTKLGFINLRYDKRGVGQSDGDYLKTGLWDLVDDARAAVQFLKAQPEVDPEKVIILGHSEGCAIGTAVAARESLGGLILLSGAVETLGEAMKRQRDIATQDILDGESFQAKLLRFLGAHKKVEKQAQKSLEKMMKSNEDTIKQSFVKVNAKWFREHIQYNVREDLAKVTCPVLAITGAKDIQANPEVLKDLPQYVKGDAEYYVVENMGHACKLVTKTSTIFSIKKDLPAEGNLPIHPELTKLLENWLVGHYQLDGIEY
ncbi:alpha/beta hydrolase [Neobacillus sp. LXY-1]|uniref:alpha/beta hydrolase n=1 Tax=Neobacillus sp. LXY-1 TaxID=3379133 RepID=UPI003EDEDA05